MRPKTDTKETHVRVHVRSQVDACSTNKQTHISVPSHQQGPNYRWTLTHASEGFTNRSPKTLTWCVATARRPVCRRALFAGGICIRLLLPFIIGCHCLLLLPCVPCVLAAPDTHDCPNLETDIHSTLIWHQVGVYGSFMTQGVQGSVMLHVCLCRECCAARLLHCMAFTGFTVG